MKRVLCLLFFVLSVQFYFTACKTQTNTIETDEAIAKKSFVEKETITVGATPVRYGDFEQELISNGKLKALRKAVVSFRVNELVTKVYAHNGQRVSKGDLIAQLESFTFKKQLEDSRNQYEKALIDLEDQLLGYGYALRDSSKMPNNTFKMAKIRSGYNQALSNLKDAERNYQHTTIRAPFDGVVANLEVQEYNQSSQYKQCCELINDQVMHVEFSVLESEMKQVKKGQAVEVIPFARKEKHYSGTITAVNPTIDEHGMITIYAKLKNEDGMLIDGMNVKILSKNIRPECIVIPKSAVLYRQNRKVVFVHKDGIAKWVYVETGEENSTEVCITDNSLLEGQEVIVSNNLNLAHETPVTVD